MSDTKRRQERERGVKVNPENYTVEGAYDFIIGCENREDALTLLEALEKRLDKHGLTLNREKTRLVRFGRRWGDGSGNSGSETFDFLGFTHIPGKDRQGRYLVKRKTARKRFSRSLKSVAEWCTNNRHLPVSVQWKQLHLKLSGHYNYYGVRGNFNALARFRHEVWKLWFNTLKRRSQKVNKNRLYNLISSVFVLPTPKITHPEGWLDLNPGYLLGRAGCGNSARPVL